MEFRTMYDGDPVASEQYFNSFKRKRSLEPEKELMLAILSDAIDCFWKYGGESGAGSRLFKEARDWIFDPDDEEPFSFVNICEALSLDPDYIRRGILRWRERREDAGRRGDAKACLKRMRRSPKGSGKCRVRPRRAAANAK
ncbi:MAG TPA: hypothetical protein VNN77_06085 [candidate division Zixibacteria bacterium]|nr:hypothetical protein [candidate division Zixibacteria bacterium]